MTEKGSNYQEYGSSKVVKWAIRLIKLSYAKPLNIGITLFIVASTLLSLKLTSENILEKDVGRSADPDKFNVETEQNVKKDAGEIWETFYNIEYGFSIEVPKLLLRKERGKEGGYLFFVIFKENRFSRSKGVAVGVSDKGLEEEEKKTREDLEKDINGFNVERKEIEVAGRKAVRLDYRRGDGVESRTIVLVNNGIFTYSISTVPGQIDRVMEGFIFYSDVDSE